MKVPWDFYDSSCKRQQLMSLSDSPICCLCDKQHTTKPHLSETHTRHDPLQLAIYSKRQGLCHLGVYVIRKMTPLEMWLQFCVSALVWGGCRYFCCLRLLGESVCFSQHV